MQTSAPAQQAISNPRTSARVRILGALLIIATVIPAMLGAFTDTATAQNSFDQQLLALTNQHRASIGRAALVPSASLNAGSLNWSNSMLASGNFAHDPTIGGLGENIATSTGPTGQPFGVTWSTAAGPLPGYCTSVMDYTTPHFMMCQWLSSTGHRNSIESANFKQFGAGTVAAGPSQARTTYSTMRFSTVAPIPVAITSPTNGSTVCGAPTLNWSGPNTGTYAVHAGSAPGLANYVNTGTGSTRSLVLNNLPTNGTNVHVRIWHLAPGTSWSLKATATYTTCNLPVAITSPTNGSTVCGAPTLNWSGPNTGTYAVHAGSAPGLANYVNTGTGSTRSLVLNNLPTNGTNVHVRIWHLAPGTSWSLKDTATYTTCNA